MFILSYECYHIIFNTSKLLDSSHFEIIYCLPVSILVLMFCIFIRIKLINHGRVIQQYSTYNPEVINNYKGVMLCARPNEKKSVETEKYPY